MKYMHNLCRNLDNLQEKTGRALCNVPHNGLHLPFIQIDFM